MRRTMIAITLPLLLCAAAPAVAATAEQKKETCTFGADDAKLEGAKRNAYMTKCMSNANYETTARRDHMKKSGTKGAKKTAPAAAPAPADADPAAPKQ